MATLQDQQAEWAKEAQMEILYEETTDEELQRAKEANAGRREKIIDEDFQIIRPQHHIIFHDSPMLRWLMTPHIEITRKPEPHLTKL